jgi:protein tyrosine kinase modulator
VLSPRERLRALRAQLTGMQGIYSDRHPAVVRTQRAIEALEAELGVESQRSPRELRAELAGLESERSELVDRYTETHPEVGRVDRQIEAVRAELAAAQRNAMAEPADAAAELADNPAYVQLRAQLESAELELASLTEREARAATRLRALEQRLTQTPMIERDYYALTRDLDNARQRYQEIRFGERSAQTAENLEMDAKGERFTLIEPPAVPEQPIAPNRPIIAFLGLILALGAAVASMALREVLDPSVHGPVELEAITGAPPVGLIPRIVNDEDRETHRRRVVYATAGAAVAFLVLLGAAHFLVMPLDQLWFRVLTRMGV